MNKKKIFKIFGIILLIFIIAFIIYTIRNYIIITDLQNKISKYSNSQNYCTKSISTQENGTTVTINYYKKGKKQVVFMERNIDGKIFNISTYDNGTRIDTFIETENSKVAQLDSNSLISMNIYNYLEFGNSLNTIFNSMFYQIVSTNYNGKECYIIKNPFSKDTVDYIEKDTGLLLKSIRYGETLEKEYEFDNVKDEIFVEPNISEYSLQ